MIMLQECFRVYCNLSRRAREVDRHDFRSQLCGREVLVPDEQCGEAQNMACALCCVQAGERCWLRFEHSPFLRLAICTLCLRKLHDKQKKLE